MLCGICTIGKQTNYSHQVYIFHIQISDAFNTLRSVRSHVTEVSSVMTANVSDPASSNGAPPLPETGPAHSNTNSGLTPPSQMSPPRPISTLQHNYSNIPQPAPVIPQLQYNAPQRPPQGPSSLPSNDNSPAGGSSPFTLGIPLNSNPQLQNGIIPSNGFSGQVFQGVEAGGGAFSRSAVRPRTPMEEKIRKRERNLAEEFRKSKLAELQDLIHMDLPLTEDSIMRALQARFFNQKYFVSVYSMFLNFVIKKFLICK